MACVTSVHDPPAPTYLQGRQKNTVFFEIQEDANKMELDGHRTLSPPQEE